MMSVAHRLAIVGCSVQHSGVSICLSILYISLNFQFIFTNAAAAVHQQQHQQIKNGRQFFMSSGAADMTSDYSVYLRRQLLLLDLTCRRPGLTAVRRACERSNNPICTSTSGFCPLPNCNVQCPCSTPNCARDCKPSTDISTAKFCRDAVTTATSGRITLKPTDTGNTPENTCFFAISVPGKTVKVDCTIISSRATVAAAPTLTRLDLTNIITGNTDKFLTASKPTISYPSAVFLLVNYIPSDSFQVDCSWTSSA